MSSIKLNRKGLIGFNDKLGIIVLSEESWLFFVADFGKTMRQCQFIGLLYLLSIQKPKKLTASFPALGFTLLEILIVTIIVGILAAISIPSYVATVDKARYGEAKSQMGCMGKQLLTFRMEKGYFPADQNRNIAPTEIDCFYTQSSGKVPFDSMYDYDMRVPSPGSCYVQIVFLGKNNAKEVPNSNTSALYPTQGIYEYSKIQSDSDDLVFSLGTNPLGVGC